MQAKFLIVKTLFLSIALLLSASVSANYSKRNDVKLFINDFSKISSYSVEELTKLFSSAKKQNRVLEAMQRPAEGKPWYDYRKIFLTPKRISRGVTFWQKYQTTLERAEKKYGVPIEIIVSIIGIETYYGKHTGSYPVFDTLVSLAFDYPKRSKFFTQELKEYLILSKQENWNHKKIKGSYAGAMGLGQFISSSYRHYAVDFNGDNKIDLFNPVDAIGSVANYFSKHGWHKNEKIIEPLLVKNIDKKHYSKRTKKPSLSAKQLKEFGVYLINRKYQGKYAIIALEKTEAEMEYWLGSHNFYVITRYNHSNLYAMSAFLLSNEIKKRI